MPLKPGDVLSHYRIVEGVGAGGMGEVYRAHDQRLERDVALKVLPSGTLADETARKRFRREALALSKLNHPNIATIFDFDTQDGVDFLVMEYVGGETLGEKLSADPLPEKEIAHLGLELAEGLAAAHGQGVVHRDLKPGNVRLTPDGRLKILDFGLAKLVQRPGPTAPTESLSQIESLTKAHDPVGTLPYMAPEQLRGERVDARSDIWAAGLVLYELATGRRAFPEGDSARLIASILQESAPSPSEANRRISPGLDSIVAKCLAKDPESRYQSAKELAVDLRRLGMAPSGTGVREVRGARRRRWIVATAGAVAAIAVGLLAWGEGWLPGAHRHAPPGKKDWILVAEFDGPPDDSTLAMTARDLISAALDQSEIVATVPQDQIRLALEAAGKPTNSHVDPELAKELAYRSAVRAVLEGKIGRLGRGYSVVLRVVDAESTKVILTESALAKNEDALIPTLGQLAKKLRAALGENRSAIQATKSMGEVATPSFEAFRLYVHGRRTLGSLADRDAIPIFRDALALDPDFAEAWWLLGIAFDNLGQPDSALAAYDEALRRPQRLTTVQRLNIRAFRALTEGDLPAALDAFERVLQYDPTNVRALWTGARAYGELGRFEEALASIRRAERVSPFGASSGMRINEVVFLCQLGRVNEAREVARYFRGDPANGWVRAWVEIAATNWAGVERIADTLLADPGLPEDERAEALLNLASARAARGALKAAAATFEQLEELARTAALSTQCGHAAYRGRMMLAIVSRGAIPFLADGWSRDSSAASFITRGLRAANEGDRSEAQRLLNAARRRPRRELAWQGAAPTLLQAQIEALAGRWEEVVRILRPIASQRIEIGEVNYPAGMSAVRWLLANAFEKLGQPDSAAVYLERITSDPDPAIQERGLRGIALPFAHRRLVMLYAQMGRLDDARRHWKIFTETVRTPDSEIRPLIEEARAALLKAEEIAARRASGA